MFKITAGVGLSFILIALMSSPASFPRATVVSIDEGLTLSEVAAELKRASIIRSATLFTWSARVLGDDGAIFAGDYFFNRPLLVTTVAWRLTHQAFGLEPVRITIHEGSTVADIADLLSARLERFSSSEFLTLAKSREGYLFPDTYFFSPYVEAWQVVKIMENNFNDQLASLRDEFLVSPLSQHEIITLASIIEKEANQPEARRLISGILHRRLEINMPLQVDAVFPYFLGKNTFELTLEDLDFDSPYNTYRYAGLPPGPIANPGLDSIVAALQPTESDYWFYLSDLQGNMHYAVDFDGHRANKASYLP